MEQKQLILEIDAAKQELIQCVNEIISKHGLCCYLIEPMFAELYAEVRSTAQRELSQAKEMAMAKSKEQTIQNY